MKLDRFVATMAIVSFDATKDWQQRSAG